MDLYQKHYLMLGIQPGDSRERVRKAYRELIRAWHPDRYGQDEKGRQLAEERSKQLNQAFQDIETYYQEHGRLPLDPSPVPAPPVAPTEPPVINPGSSTPPQPFRRYPQSPEASIKPGTPTRKAARVMIIAALILVWFVYSSWEPVPEETTGNATQTQPISQYDLASAPPALDNPRHVQTGFAVGSTMGEVFAIQGQPNQVDGNIWRYGGALVFFRDGKVSHWRDTTPPRLLIASGTRSPLDTWMSSAVFTRGASKSEVRAIQGLPLRESDTAWEYGLSQVYFDRNGRVSGWDESPFDPLHIKR